MIVAAVALSNVLKPSEKCDFHYFYYGLSHVIPGNMFLVLVFGFLSNIFSSNDETDSNKMGNHLINVRES